MPKETFVKLAPCIVASVASRGQGLPLDIQPVSSSYRQISSFVWLPCEDMIGQGWSPLAMPWQT